MHLNQRQLEEFTQWMLDKKANTDALCPICGTTSWSTGEIVIAETFVDKQMELGKTQMPVSPMLQVICDNCAYVRLFSTIRMGLRDD
jgi:predicted nucleic-acid-binding Zn-ribbon protein